MKNINIMHVEIGNQEKKDHGLSIQRLTSNSNTNWNSSTGSCLKRRFLPTFILICAVSIIYVLCFGEFILSKSTNLASSIDEKKQTKVSKSPTEKQRENMNLLYATVFKENGTHPDANMTCHLPKLKPFDETIVKYVHLPTKILDCTKAYKRPIIFSTDFNCNLITINDPAQYKLYDCCYKQVERKAENTVKTAVNCTKIHQNSTPIPQTFNLIEIRCKNSTGEMELVDIHSVIHKKPAKIKKNEKESLNIVVLGLDSISHMNFIRTMPQSYAYLVQNLSAFGLNGFTKVADNTFPNIVPVLTGLNISQLETLCWGKKYFDSCPFLWKNFSQSGYYTQFSEDDKDISIFNYHKKGFNEQPTDYYTRPFTIALEEKFGYKHLCSGPRLAFSILLNQIQKLAATMTDANENTSSNFFSFTWATSMSHDNLNDPNHGDEYLLSWMKWFKEDERQLLDNNTLLILMSDHGTRYGSIRETLQGRIEERMPFLYFVFPKWFKKKFSVATNNLKLNKNRLSTPFDLHETLKDLLELENNLSNERIKDRHFQLLETIVNSEMPRGISLFLPIPLTRTCKNGAIDNHWCVCNSVKPIVNPSNNTKVIKAASVILSNLNGKLKKFPQCAKLDLGSIVNAQELIQHSDFIKKSASKPTKSTEKPTTTKPEPFKPTKLTLTIQTKPGDALFEATIAEEETDSWKLSADISRINSYGNQSRCVSDYNMKMYCFCS